MERTRDLAGPEPAPEASAGECLLVYDGQCRLCLTAKQGLERLDARTGTPGKATPVRFVPYQSEEAARRLGPDYRPGRPEVAFFIHEDGTVSQGLDAFLPLVPGLPGGRVLQRLMRVRAIRPLATWLYRLIARNRYRWFGEVKQAEPRPPSSPI